MARLRAQLAAGLGLLLAVTATLGLGAAPADATTFSQPTTWNFTAADIPGAASLGNGGAGVTVAVLDTWIDESHPEFGGRVLAGYDCASGVCTAGPPAQDGCEPHGTHVAGVLGSKDYGVAPSVTILPVRVLAVSAGQCVAKPAAVAAGITAAQQAGARVINVSLGADDSSAGAVAAEQPIVSAANAAAAAGDLVIFAAGNSGNVNAAGSFGNAVSVGAVGPSKTLASYSNTGATLLAPGGDSASSGSDCSGDPNAAKDCIESTWYCTVSQSGCDPHGLAYDEGTSMAAPVVAGLGALMFAQNPGRGLANVVSVLESTAHATTGSSYGLIDGCKALLADAKAGSTCGTGTTTVKAPARTFAGCPKTVTVVTGRKPTIKCRISPKQGGVVVSVQVPHGKSWQTVSKVKTARDGSFKAVGPAEKKASKLRLLIGKLSVTVTVKVKK